MRRNTLPVALYDDIELTGRMERPRPYFTLFGQSQCWVVGETRIGLSSRKRVYEE